MLSCRQASVGLASIYGRVEDRSAACPHRLHRSSANHENGVSRTADRNRPRVRISTSVTGTRVVRGKVVDEDFAESIYSATVTIKNVQQGTTDLLGEVSTAPLAPDIRKALMTKLDAALSAIAKGKTNAACGALKDFISQVYAQRGKAIDTATADAWILTAQQLQAAIGC